MGAATDNLIIPGWEQLTVWEGLDGARPQAFLDAGLIFQSDHGSVKVTAELSANGKSGILRVDTRPGQEALLLISQLGSSDSQVCLMTNVKADSHGVVAVHMAKEKFPAGTYRVELSAKTGSLFLKRGRMTEISVSSVPPSDSALTPVVAGIATIPGRLDKFRSVVSAILPQVDHLYVYLNDFVSVPSFLCVEGVTVFRSQDFGDWRDNSKFFGLYCLEGDAFYLTVDDDIFYPDDYVKSLVDASSRHGNRAVVGYHGVIYGAGSGAFRDRATFHFEEALRNDMPVNVLGTGTSIFHTQLYRPDPLGFSQCGMVDLLVGSSLQSLNIPMIAVARDAGQLMGMPHEKSSFTLFEETKVRDSVHDQFIRAHTWSLAPCRDHADGDIGVFCEEALLLLRYEELLAGGARPGNIAVPSVVCSAVLSERLGAVALRISGLAGELIKAHSSLKGSVDATDWQEISGQLEEYCDSIADSFTLIHPSHDGGGDRYQDYELDDEDLALLAAQGRNDLVLLDAAIKFRRKPGIDTCERVLSSALMTLDAALFEPIVSRVEMIRPLSEREHGELMTARLRRGEVDYLLDSSSRLLKGHFAPRLALAMAALSANKPWAGDLVLSLLLNTKPTPKSVRRLRGLLEALRTSNCVFDLAGFSSCIKLIDKSLRVDLMSTLVSHGYWDDACSEIVSGLPEQEKALWVAKSAELKFGNKKAVLSAFNAGYLRKGLVPLFIDGESDDFFRLLRTPVAIYESELDAPKVSVIVTAFNAQDTFDYAIRSILEQSYPNIEIIVVDDCSESPLSIDAYKAPVKGRSVKLLRLSVNSGPYAARNAALDCCTGEYVATHDSDDWMHPQKLERHIAEMQSGAVVASYSKHVRVTADGRLALENHGRFIGDGPITSVFHRSVFDRIGRFRPVRTRGDIEFKSRLISAYGPAKIVSLDYVSVLALDSDFSNSKRCLKTWVDQVALVDFKLNYGLEHPVRFMMKKVA